MGSEENEYKNRQTIQQPMLSKRAAVWVYCGLPMIVYIGIVMSVELGVKPKCGFLGISEIVYSMYRYKDCPFFAARDWIFFSGWYIGTLVCIGIAYETMRNENYEKKELFMGFMGYVFFATMFMFFEAAILPFLALMLIVVPVSFLFKSEDTKKIEDPSDTESTQQHAQNPVAEVKITVKDLIKKKKTDPDDMNTINPSKPP